jgi:hypothetical protein
MVANVTPSFIPSAANRVLVANIIITLQPFSFQFIDAEKVTQV